MRKLLTILLVSISFICLIGCKKSEYVHLYELVEPHLYSENIEISVPYINEDNKYEYCTFNFPYILQCYMSSLYHDEYAKSESTNKQRFIKQHTNEKTFIVKSIIDEDALTAYVNEDGSVIVESNDKLFITKKSAVDYSDFVCIVSSKDINEFNFDSNIEAKDNVRIINVAYSSAQDEIKEAYYRNFLENKCKDIMMLKLPSNIYGEKHYNLSRAAYPMNSLFDDEKTNRIYIGLYGMLISYNKQWALIPQNTFELDNYLLIGKLMDESLLTMMLRINFLSLT